MISLSSREDWKRPVTALNDKIGANYQREDQEYALAFVTKAQGFMSVLSGLLNSPGVMIATNKGLINGADLTQEEQRILHDLASNGITTSGARRLEDQRIFFKQLPTSKAKVCIVPTPAEIVTNLNTESDPNARKVTPHFGIERRDSEQDPDLAAGEMLVNGLAFALMAFSGPFVEPRLPPNLRPQIPAALRPEVFPYKPIIKATMYEQFSRTQASL